MTDVANLRVAFDRLVGTVPRPGVSLLKLYMAVGAPNDFPQWLDAVREKWLRLELVKGKQSGCGFLVAGKWFDWAAPVK